MASQNYDPDREGQETPYTGYYGTGAPKRCRSHGGWLIFLVFLLLLASAGVIFSSKYEVELTQNATGVSLSIAEKEEETEAEPPAQAETQAPNAQTEAQQAPAAAVGTGAQLQITPQHGAGAEGETGEEPEGGTASGALTLQEIYQKMIPSVVSIVSTTQSGTASGTGIIMTEDGYIITNNHVVENGLSIQVLLYDETEYAASLVGADSVSDLAVLKIEAENSLTAAEFGDSNSVQVGDTVVAIGDPLGIELRGTMTDGIISAINRDLTVNGRNMTLLQTNAQLNNGNSGGPLINLYGQVIGINTMKMGSYYSSSVEGLGFAIPIATAKPIVDELIAQGYVSGRPAIGIQGEAVPAYAKAYYRMPNGVFVSFVFENSDAYQTGLQEGDIITAIDGTEVTSMDELNAVKNQHVAGDTVTLTIYRGGAYYEISIVLMDQNEAD